MNLFNFFKLLLSSSLILVPSKYCGVYGESSALYVSTSVIKI